MTEKLAPRDNPEQLSLEAEAGTGTPDSDPAIEDRIDQLVDQGFSYGVAARMVGVELDPAESEAPVKADQGQRSRPGYVKGGSRRRIKTPADARAADRLPDEDWRYS